MYQEIINASFQSIMMIFGAGALTVLLGLPIAIFLAQSRHKNKLPKVFAFLLDVMCAIPQRIPYLVWMVLLIPVTHKITQGRIDHYLAAIIPLTLATLPYFIQHVSQQLSKLSPHLLHTTMSFGATSWQQIQTIYFGEGRTIIIEFTKRSLVHLIGFSTVAGALGAGGLGQVAMQYSQNFQLDPLLMVTAVLLLFTFTIEGTGHLFLKKS